MEDNNTIDEYSQEDLVEGMYDEVRNYYVNDLGEVPKHAVNEINIEMTLPNTDRKKVLDNVIRKLYVLLINGNNDKIKEKIAGLGTHTIELHDINLRIQEIETDLKKPRSIIELKKIYLEKSKPTMFIAADKIRIENNKMNMRKKDWNKDIIKDLIIAIVFFILGKYA